MLYYLNCPACLNLQGYQHYIGKYFKTRLIYGAQITLLYPHRRGGAEGRGSYRTPNSSLPLPSFGGAGVATPYVP